jgi:hypothetical protein
MENSKMMVERQIKELKAKLEEAENSKRAKAKAAIGMHCYFLGVSVSATNPAADKTGFQRIIELFIQKIVTKLSKI